MLRNVLFSKIHRATVTDANINYEGSITLDSTLMAKARLKEYEKVMVVDINNGARFETYVIKGKAKSGVVCINGAAARLVSIGDLVIIMAFAWLDDKELDTHTPTLVVVDENNVPKG